MPVKNYTHRPPPHPLPTTIVLNLPACGVVYFAVQDGYQFSLLGMTIRIKGVEQNLHKVYIFNVLQGG